MANINRRQFISNLAIATTFLICPGLKAVGLTDSDNENSQKNKLLVIFLRGAIDGLNIVTPYGDKRYYEYRPTIAIPSPKDDNGLVDLDGFFGLNPGLKSLKPYWDNKSLAFVYASGSPDPTRSHFDAQDYMESGTPGVKSTTSGWMNRLVSVLPKSQSPINTVNFGPIMPRILDGPNKVANISLGKALAKPQVYDRPIINKFFSELYTNSNDELSHNYNEAMKAHHIVIDELQKEMVAANNGAPTPNENFGKQIATLFTGQANITSAFISFGGFDTHVNQGNTKGQLFNHVNNLGNGLANLIEGLGSIYKHTTIVIISEFGRTAHENGNAGTDHGHGNVIWLLGEPIAGGKVYAKFSGLAANELYENRDIPVNTDFRDVLSLILNEHMGISQKELKNIFPDYNLPKQPLPIFG